MSTLDTTLIAIAGILVSGVVGPQLTSWSARRANRKQFNREQNARRRDDLRTLLDEAAILLASGATNLRHMQEDASRGQESAPDVTAWLAQVFPLGQRLRLRLPESHRVVQAYDDVREALAAAADVDIETVVSDYEAKRAHFLDLARETLNVEIPEKGDIE